MPANDELRWFKSSHSGGNETCVEAAVRVGGPVLLRDSKVGASSPVLSFTPSQWRAFLGAVRSGELGG